ARDRKPALELVRRAEILQASGEDWSGVALSVSTVRTARGGGAPELPPLVVGYPPPPAPPPVASRGDFNAVSEARRDRVPYVPASTSFADEDAARKVVPPVNGGLIAQEQNAVFATGGFQAVFRVPGRVSVATNEGAKSFRIGGATIAPDLLVRST